MKKSSLRKDASLNVLWFREVLCSSCRTLWINSVKIEGRRYHRYEIRSECATYSTAPWNCKAAQSIIPGPSSFSPQRQRLLFRRSLYIHHVERTARVRSPLNCGRFDVNGIRKWRLVRLASEFWNSTNAWNGAVACSGSGAVVSEERDQISSPFLAAELVDFHAEWSNARRNQLYIQVRPVLLEVSFFQNTKLGAEGAGGGAEATSRYRVIGEQSWQEGLLGFDRFFRQPSSVSRRLASQIRAIIVSHWVLPPPPPSTGADLDSSSGSDDGIN